MAKEVSPGVKALRKVVDDVHADARQAAKEGKLVGEKEGVVTGTGLYNGQRVIFVGDETYLLNQIMAVGKLPPKPDESEKPDETEPPEGVEPPDETEPPEGDGGEDAASTPPALG